MLCHYLLLPLLYITRVAGSVCGPSPFKTRPQSIWAFPLYRAQWFHPLSSQWPKAPSPVATHHWLHPSAALCQRFSLTLTKSLSQGMRAMTPTSRKNSTKATQPSTYTCNTSRQQHSEGSWKYSFSLSTIWNWNKDNKMFLNKETSLAHSQWSLY